MDKWSERVNRRSFDIGIVAVACGIDVYTIKRFVKSIRDSNPKCSYTVLIARMASDEKTPYAHVVSDQDLEAFNKCKMLNSCVRHLFKTCTVIACTDIDMIIPQGLIDETFKRALEGVNVWGQCRLIPMEKSPDEWPSIKIRGLARGSWIAMTPENWKKSGGWNEGLFGWRSSEDKEFYYRRKKRGIKDVVLNQYPLLHLGHPRRPWKYRRAKSNAEATDGNWI